MKLIQVSKAAEKLGVTRQTIENWGKSGILNICKISKNSHWVDAEALEALADTIQDIGNARRLLEQEQKQLEEDYRKERQLRMEVERELFVGGKLGSAVCCKEFYLSIPVMLSEIGQISDRECVIMRAVIDGQGIGSIAEKFGLSRVRVFQIFYKGCRKARELSNIKEQLDELRELKKEISQMKAEMKIMADELELQRVAEQEFKETEELDKILELYNTSIEEYSLRLSIRSINCLKAAGIQTIGDLIKYRKTELLTLRNFGKNSLKELDELLDNLGLSFGTDVNKVYRARIVQRLQSEKNI